MPLKFGEMISLQLKIFIDFFVTKKKVYTENINVFLILDHLFKHLYLTQKGFN